MPAKKKSRPSPSKAEKVQPCPADQPGIRLAGAIDELVAMADTPFNSKRQLARILGVNLSAPSGWSNYGKLPGTEEYGFRPCARTRAWDIAALYWHYTGESKSEADLEKIREIVSDAKDYQGADGEKLVWSEESALETFKKRWTALGTKAFSENDRNDPRALVFDAVEELRSAGLDRDSEKLLEMVSNYMSQKNADLLIEKVQNRHNFLRLMIFWPSPPRITKLLCSNQKLKDYLSKILQPKGGKQEIKVELYVFAPKSGDMNADNKFKDELKNFQKDIGKANLLESENLLLYTNDSGIDGVGDMWVFAPPLDQNVVATLAYLNEEIHRDCQIAVDRVQLNTAAWEYSVQSVKIPSHMAKVVLTKYGFNGSMDEEIYDWAKGSKWKILI